MATLDEQLTQLMHEATEARHGIPQGDIDDGPLDLHTQLLAARKATDKLEDILVRIQAALNQARKSERLAQEALEDAEANYISTRKTFTGDYATSKEKNAEMLLATTEEHVTLRKAERQAALLKEVLYYVQTLHSGATGARRDIDTRLRLITLQSQLEK